MIFRGFFTKTREIVGLPPWMVTPLSKIIGEEMNALGSEVRNSVESLNEVTLADIHLEIGAERSEDAELLPEGMTHPPTVAAGAANCNINADFFWKIRLKKQKMMENCP